MNEVKLDRHDVRFERYKPRRCDNCEKTATTRVVLDLRGNGVTLQVGIYCGACADGVADRLRDSLPVEN